MSDLRSKRLENAQKMYNCAVTMHEIAVDLLYERNCYHVLVKDKTLWDEYSRMEKLYAMIDSDYKRAIEASKSLASYRSAKALCDLVTNFYTMASKLYEDNIR